MLFIWYSFHSFNIKSIQEKIMKSARNDNEKNGQAIKHLLMNDISSKKSIWYMIYIWKKVVIRKNDWYYSNKHIQLWDQIRFNLLLKIRRGYEWNKIWRKKLESDWMDALDKSLKALNPCEYNPDSKGISIDKWDKEWKRLDRVRLVVW